MFRCLMCVHVNVYVCMYARKHVCVCLYAHKYVHACVVLSVHGLEM